MSILIVCLQLFAPHLLILTHTSAGADNFFRHSDHKVRFHVLLQVNHIFKQNALFNHAVVIVINKEILNAVGIFKTAVLIESNCAWNISGPNYHLKVLS